MPDVISPTQNTFVSGRLILDNVLVAYEAMHTMNNKFSGDLEFMSLKIDMSLA